MQLSCGIVWCSLGKPLGSKPQCRFCRYAQQGCRLHTVAASMQALGCLPACCRINQSRVSKHAVSPMNAEISLMSDLGCVCKALVLLVTSGRGPLLT